MDWKTTTEAWYQQLFFWLVLFFPPCVTPSILELTLLIRLASNSQRSSCLCLLSVEIKDGHHHYHPTACFPFMWFKALSWFIPSINFWHLNYVTGFEFYIADIFSYKVTMRSLNIIFNYCPLSSFPKCPVFLQWPVYPCVRFPVSIWILTCIDFGILFCFLFRICVIHLSHTCASNQGHSLTNWHNCSSFLQEAALFDFGKIIFVVGYNVLMCTVQLLCLTSPTPIKQIQGKNNCTRFYCLYIDTGFSFLTVAYARMETSFKAIRMASFLYVYCSIFLGMSHPLSWARISCITRRVCYSRGRVSTVT
jgi:hypothetical protein